MKNLMALFIGVLLVLLFEGVLWAIKFHKPLCEFDPYISFKESVPVLVEFEYKGEKWLRTNPRLKAYFNQIAFPEKKSNGTRRIFILGESSTLGFPSGDSGSYSWFLKLGLDRLDFGYRYQVINLGAFGFASYRILRVFREVMRYEPDLIIVMTGQNEFLEKREYSDSVRFIRFYEALSRLRTYCLLKVIVMKLKPERERRLLSADVKWEKMSSEGGLREKVKEHFRFNVNEVARMGSERGIPVLFLTNPVNLKDFPPYHSVHRKNMNSEELADFEDKFKTAQRLIAEERHKDAEVILRRLIEIDDGYAMSFYLLGQCLLKDGKISEAKDALIKALDRDAWQVRALPEFNEIIRGLKASNLYVLDMERVFEDQSPDGIPGNNFFYDHCHPTLDAQGLIAKKILEKLNEEQWLKLEEGWEDVFDEVVNSYKAGLGSEFWVHSYYNLAVEIGMNMGFKEMGRDYLELGLKISPNDPKLKKLSEMLKQGL